MEAYALELEQLRKEYSGFTLEDVTLRLPTGCIMGLIGENGAGKSTTIKSILNLVHPSGGEIRVLGCDNKSAAFTQMKEQIGVAMDEACFPDCMTPAEVNRVMRGLYAGWEEETYFSYLKKFRLPLDKRFKEFSRGMKMKLSIATALSHGAKLLVLDEATSGLDPIVRDELLDVFLEFTRDEEHSILISSHIISDLEKICDYIAFLHEGRLLFCEEKDLLTESYGLLNVSRENFATIAPAAVISARNSGYGVQALVKRELVPEGFAVERADIESIIVAMAKEERK